MKAAHHILVDAAAALAVLGEAPRLLLRDGLQCSRQGGQGEEIHVTGGLATERITVGDGETAAGRANTDERASVEHDLPLLQQHPVLLLHVGPHLLALLRSGVQGKHADQQRPHLRGKGGWREDG